MKLARDNRVLAILVVYVVPEGWEWLLRIHLDMISQMSKRVHPRVLGVAVRCSDKARDLLRSQKNVELLSFPSCPKRSSVEHGYYLDLLASLACERGFRYFLTLDVDSFPIRRDWFENLSVQLSDKAPFAAVFREENRDVNLPHPSGLLCSMDFFRRFRPQFFPDIETDEETRAFLKKTAQRQDTGIGFVSKVDALNLDWIRLRRTNVVNDHHLMAGIYGDAFFHLGAMSRAPRFYGDWVTTPRRAQLIMTRRLVEASPWWQEQWDIEDDRIARENKKSQKAIIARLRCDHKSYIRFLRYGRIPWRMRLKQLTGTC